MKVCSFLPAATQMIYDMGLDHLLCGVTFECPTIALKNKAIVVRCILEGKNLTSAEIDTVFSTSKTEGNSLYQVDEALLQAISPDIIFTQDTCEVCQIDTKCTANAVAKLPKQPVIISLSPNSLEDVFECAFLIAKALGSEKSAVTYISNLQSRLNKVTDTLRAHQAPLKRVMLMEWIEPIYNCGHWIPYQIAYAGGVDMLSNPSGESIVTPWDKIVQYNPQVIVIAPCGFFPERTIEEIDILTTKPAWSSLLAVQTNNVYIANFDLFTQPSASTLTDGIELLAGLFHPEIFKIPEQLVEKYYPLNLLMVH